MAVTGRGGTPCLSQHVLSTLRGGGSADDDEEGDEDDDYEDEDELDDDEGGDNESNDLIQRILPVLQSSLSKASEVAMSGFRRGSDVAMAGLKRGLQSLVSMAEESLPGSVVTSTLRSVVHSVEQILGIQILEEEKTEAKRKTKTKRKKNYATRSSSSSSEKKEPTIDSTTSDVSSEKKKAAAVKAKKKKRMTNTPTSTALKHLKKELKSTNPNYRIQRELKAFMKEPPENLSVKVGKNLRVWIVTMHGAANTIYEGETFLLRISFPPSYPTVPPSVYFLPGHIPVHEHVYTNGDICLSLLGKDWRPTMTAQSIAVSILSILSSAQHKELPMDNAAHAHSRPGQYQKDWVYHDDNC